VTLRYVAQRRAEKLLGSRTIVHQSCQSPRTLPEMPDLQTQKPKVSSNTLHSASSTNKRKSPSGLPVSTNLPKRLRAAIPSKQLATVPTSLTFPGNEVSVARFVRAREIEIRALEDGMRRAKKFQMRRAFQDVPRDMRRRTASHNPRRVPGRLRSRAVREMREDQTPLKRGESGSGTGKGSKGRLRAEGVSRVKRKRVNRRNHGEEEQRHLGIVPIEYKAKVMVPTNRALQDASSKKNTLVNTLHARTPKINRSAALKNPPIPLARFRKRQIHKTWLPTHMFHTKRAHMTAPSEPLWRFAIPLTPTAKSYRPTHRANTLRGSVTWDMSYIATIGLEGPEASLVGLLKALGVGIDYEEDLWGNMGIGKKWRDGSRFWEGWTFEKHDCRMEGIAPVTIIWSAKEGEGADTTDQQQVFSTKKREKRRAFIRVHPAGFLRLWGGVVRLAKVQKPAVTVEDLRFEIGSIEISGPGATETLCSALWPTPCPEGKVFPADSPQNIWKDFSILTNPSSLPANTLLAFTVSDPRLHYPPQTMSVLHDTASVSRLAQTLANWPLDMNQSPAAIFNRNARLAASRTLPSQKSINRRKGSAMPGEYPEPRPTDPQIPILLCASRQRGVWTVLLPWKCVLPIWRTIMYYPLSSGGNPRFGGLKETRQVYFESSRPWFPGDYPGTSAGWAWEIQERAVREKEWAKRPKGKRIEWGSVDLGDGRKGEVGRGWACDWEAILTEESLAKHGRHYLPSSSLTNP